MKKIIFDTDLGGDCDDVMALDLLLSCERSSECELIGVTYSADAKAGVSCIHAILRRYGRGVVPIGRAPIPEGKKVVSDTYASKVSEAFYSPDGIVYETAHDAVRLLRSLLASNESVTLCVTGFLTNIAALLLSKPDDISPKDGISLAAEKIGQIVIMGCNFSHENGINPEPWAKNADGAIKPVGEWNIICDIPAARTVADLSPAPLVFCPFELGAHMITGAAMAKRGGHGSPDSLSYIIHGSENGRDSWDPATALYAVRGAGYWFTAERGRCLIAEDGISHFELSEDGPHLLLECAIPQPEVAAIIDGIVAAL